MKSNLFKKTLYACLFLTALSSITSCSKEENISKTSNTDTNSDSKLKSSIPDISYHPTMYKMRGTYYIRMFEGSTYVTPSKPRRVVVTFDAWWNKVVFTTVNKTYTVMYTGYQAPPLNSKNPLLMKFEIDKITNNPVQYSQYNNLDQLVTQFLGNPNKVHIVTSPSGDDLRFGKSDLANSTINAYFVRN